MGRLKDKAPQILEGRKLPTSGAISLNQIHVEAGGTSGTNCTINDADIRGLIGKAASTPMSFSEWYGAANLSMSGGSESVSGGYKYHVFTTSGTLKVSGTWSVEVFIVGGGGGSAGFCGGGGGGGQVKQQSLSIGTGNHTVTAGAGGTAWPAANYYQQNGKGGNGGTSSIGSLISASGGVGGRSRYQDGYTGFEVPGPNVGAGGASGSGKASGKPYPRSGQQGSAGGGGQNGVGGDGRIAGSYTGYGGNGGAGVARPSGWITSIPAHFGGGGGGGVFSMGDVGIGSHGGGNGGIGGSSNDIENSPATAGETNTGGGAGGAGRDGKVGGSGIVVVRYRI